MNCDDAELLLAQELAGELSAGERPALDEHLAACERCRELRGQWESDDRALRAGFAAWRGGADVVAARTIRQLRREQSAPARQSAWRRTALVFACGVAAGLLVALLITMPSNVKETAERGPGATPTAPDTQPGEAPIAELGRAEIVAKVGQVESRLKETGVWSAMQADETLPVGACLRTGVDGLCELALSDGQRVRMNTQSEVCLRDGGELDLRCGQVWASAAARPIAVHLASGSIQSADGAVDVQLKADRTNVMSTSGAALVRMASQEQSLMAGEELEFVGQSLAGRRRVYSVALLTAWMHPLLAIKSPDDPELNARVDDLLAHLGEVKVNLLSESELRHLGPSCTPPLARFVRSDRSLEQMGARRRAAGLLSDLAPLSLAGELIELLGDEDGEVRERAAAGLRRLTGLDFDCPPEVWRDHSDESRQRATEEWRTWWELNRFRCPPLPQQAPVRRDKLKT